MTFENGGVSLGAALLQGPGQRVTLATWRRRASCRRRSHFHHQFRERHQHHVQGNLQRRQQIYDQQRNPDSYLSSTTLASSSNPTLFGQAVTFTATVASSNTGLAPTGLVTFLTSASVLGTAALVTRTVLLQPLFRRYSPRASARVSPALQPFTAAIPVTPAVCRQALPANGRTSRHQHDRDSSSSSSVFGQSVTFSATISPTTPAHRVAW